MDIIEAVKAKKISDNKKRALLKDSVLIMISNKINKKAADGKYRCKVDLNTEPDASLYEEYLKSRGYKVDVDEQGKHIIKWSK